MAVDPYDISKLSIPYWMSYRWVRKSLFGVDDPLSISEAMKKGWRPVRRDEHPDIVASVLSANDEYIECGGLALMKRPDHLTMAAEADQRRKSYELSKVGAARVISPEPPVVTAWDWIKHPFLALASRFT